MKKPTFIIVALLTALIARADSSYFFFNNIYSSGAITIAPYTFVTNEGAPGNFVGTDYTVSLYWGSSTATSFGQLQLLPGVDTKFFGNAGSEPTQINGAGFFNGGDAFLPIPAVPITVAVAVWYSGPGPFGVATSYNQALADFYNTGFSQLISISSHSGTNPNVDDLHGLASFSVSVVPEPATVALCSLGAASLLLFHRKKP